MNKLKKLGLILTLGTALLSNFYAKSEEIINQNTGQESIGEFVLRSEEFLGATKEESSTLENIVNEAKSKIIKKENYTKEEAFKILTTISDLLETRGYSNDLQLTFNEALRSKKLDCDSSSLIYLSVAEKLGLPLKLVVSPNHAFIRFKLNNEESVNWETLYAKELKERAKYGIDNAFIPDESYLGKLKEGETLKELDLPQTANFYARASLNNSFAPKDGSKTFMIKRDDTYIARERKINQSLIEYLSKRLEYDNNKGEVYEIRGEAYERIGELDKALTDYKLAKELEKTDKIQERIKRVEDEIQGKKATERLDKSLQGLMLKL